MLQDCETLDELWSKVFELNREHFPENNLMPIFGGGRIHKPRFMFVLINPTHTNQSSDPDWQGPRFPFLGKKDLWRVFYKAGLLNDELMGEIEDRSTWSVAFANKVLKFLDKKELYLTNIVKWTGHDANLPDSNKTNLFLPILEREIEMIQPEYIIAFGLIPFQGLTKQKIKLSEYYSDVISEQELKFYEVEVRSVRAKVIPCYFPVGRGDRKKAVEILKLLDSIS